MIQKKWMSKVINWWLRIYELFWFLAKITYFSLRCLLFEIGILLLISHLLQVNLRLPLIFVLIIYSRTDLCHCSYVYSTQNLYVFLIHFLTYYLLISILNRSISSSSLFSCHFTTISVVSKVLLTKSMLGSVQNIKNI